MDVLSELKSIVDSGSHYLRILNSINSFLFNGAFVKYSAFYFLRGEKEFLVASVGKELVENNMKIEITKKNGSPLGYWIVNSEIDSKIFFKTARLMSEKLFFDEWEYNFSFTQNKGCEYFPCHKIEDEDKFSCLFCYCPLYLISDCGGEFSLLPNGMKDCSNCLLPHKQESYNYIVSKLSSFHKS